MIMHVRTYFITQSHTGRYCEPSYQNGVTILLIQELFLLRLRKLKLFSAAFDISLLITKAIIAWRWAGEDDHWLEFQRVRREMSVACQHLPINFLS